MSELLRSGHGKTKAKEKLEAMNAELVEALQAINEAADNYHSGHDDEGYVTVPVALIAAAVDVAAKAKGESQ